MGEEELQVLRKLRASLSGLEPAKAHDQLLSRLKRTATNLELLRQVQTAG